MYEFESHIFLLIFRNNYCLLTLFQLRWKESDILINNVSSIFNVWRWKVPSNGCIEISGFGFDFVSKAAEYQDFT